MRDPFRFPAVLLVTAIVAMPAAPVLAQRPSTVAMGCRQAKALVDRSAGIVLGTAGRPTIGSCGTAASAK